MPRLVNWVKLVETAITGSAAEFCHSSVCTDYGATRGPAFLLNLMVVDSRILRNQITKPEKACEICWLWNQKCVRNTGETQQHFHLWGNIMQCYPAPHHRNTAGLLLIQTCSDSSHCGSTELGGFAPTGTCKAPSFLFLHVLG